MIILNNNNIDNKEIKPQGQIVNFASLTNFSP